MKLKEYSKEDLETMSYDDIALLILTDSKKKMKINELFKEVCDLLALSEKEYMDKLPAFFDVLSTDGRFIMLENGLWDLKTRHSTKVVIDEDEEDEEEFEDIEEIDEDEETDEEKDIYSDDPENEDQDDDDDDLKDLVIIDEDEETNGM